MKYRVVYTDSFLADIESHIDYLLSEGASPRIVSQWYDRLFIQFDSLDAWPRMYPVDEAYTDMVGRLTRKINFHDYLVMYQVNDDDERIEVVAFFHGGRDR